MSETALAPQGQTINQSVSPEEQFEAVKNRLDDIGFNPDANVRANDIAQWGVNDLIAASTLIHAEVAPNADINPTDFSMKMSSPEGVTTAVLMDPEKRYDFLKYATDKIQELGKTLKPGDERGFLDRAANIVGMATVLAHSFEDGNGRTSRTLAYAIKEGYDPDNQDRLEDFKAVATERPKEGYKMLGIIPYDKDLTPEQQIDALAAVDIPLIDRQAYLDRASKVQFSPLNYPIKE